MTGHQFRKFKQERKGDQERNGWPKGSTVSYKGWEVKSDNTDISIIRLDC